MQMFRRFITVLYLFTFLFTLAACGEKETEQSYDEIMRDLDPKTANGSLLTSYNINNGMYLDKYVPEELLAESPEEVGYILRLNLHVGEKSCQYVGPLIFGDQVSIQFLDCASGEIVAEKVFDPYFPEKVTMNYRATPLDSEVLEWVEHIYALQEGGEKAEHIWQEGDGTEVKTCKLCGATED